MYTKLLSLCRGHYILAVILLKIKICLSVFMYETELFKYG